MPVIDQTEAYPEEARFWRLVETPLTGIFQVDGRQAAGLVNARLRSLAEAPPGERLLGFHAEPLDVAASLADRSVEPEDVGRYLALAAGMGWSGAEAGVREPAAA